MKQAFCEIALATGVTPQQVELIHQTFTARAMLPESSLRPEDADRDGLGRVVRAVWIAWAEEQPDPKPSWLVPYDDLSESDKEADRRIGEALFRLGALNYRNDELDYIHSLYNDATEVLESHRRLTRRLDIALNGEEGAAPQASLCDIVAQVEQMKATQALAAMPDDVLSMVDQVIIDGAPSHSQQSARITSADQFINGRYYWVKLTNPKVVSYGETVIWGFTDIPRGNPFLAHHPVDSKLFANAEIYGPVPMPELSREHCPSQQSAHRITKQDAREIAESLEYYFDNIRQEFDFSAWWGSKGRELLGKLNADRCPSHESKEPKP